MMFYESNILGTKGPRKMKVLKKYNYLKAIFPSVDESGIAF